MPFVIGESVGPYRILEQLGQGGMATVFKAYHAALDRHVALKVLHPAFMEDPNFLARFQREARLVAKLEHPYIVPVYDYAEHERRPYLVMKFIEGETLKARLGRGPLTSQEIADVVDVVGAALTYAHTQGVLHRDIKPSNVLIATDGQIYLADFGLARIAQAGESTLSSDVVMGTPQYISPEQAMGKKDLNEGTDIYSFGIMLYEMVVGQVPFSADTPFSIIHDHIYSPLPLPRAINKNVPESVERVLLKALAKERGDRFADVGSMVSAFKQAWETAGVPMQGTAITLPPHTVRAAGKATAKRAEVTPPPTRVAVVEPAGATVVGKEPRKKRSPWPFVAAGILVLLCCGFLLAARQGGFFPPPDKPTATAPAPTAILSTESPKTPAQPKTPAIDKPTSPEIEEARERVAASPNDPEAHLNLSLAYWDAGYPRLAFESLKTAADLAGQDGRFFVNAAEQMKERGAWIGAAAMYLRAINARGGMANASELLTPFHEAVYKAAIEPEMPAYLPFDAIARVDEPISLIARARHSLYNGGPEDGRIFLNQVNTLKPGMFESALLETEFLIKNGKTQEAKVALSDLDGNLSAPEWIRAEAHDLLLRLP